jgi:hypothetical protein
VDISSRFFQKTLDRSPQMSGLYNAAPLGLVKSHVKCLTELDAART